MRFYPIVVVAILLVVILSIPVPPGQSRFVLELLDAGHAPLFGFAALVLIRTAPHRRTGSWLEYALVLLLTTLIGVLTELVQWAEGGDAELNDVVADAVGAASFLAIHWTSTHKSATAFRWLLTCAAVAGLAAIFSLPILSGMATLHRNMAFPVILNFDSIWDSRRCRPDGATFEITAAPRGAGRRGRDLMGCITFERTKVSAWVIDESYPNWKGYRHFAFTAYSELSKPVQLVLRIYDRHFRNSSSGRYETQVTINPGNNNIRIPLFAVEGSAATHRLDLGAIYRIVLLAENPENRFSVYVDDFHLE